MRSVQMNWQALIESELRLGWHDDAWWHLQLARAEGAELDVNKLIKLSKEYKPYDPD